jgi:hypothetical protein
MNPTDSNDRVEGTLLLRIARLVFVEPALSSVVYPAIADFEHELRGAGANRARRLAVRARAGWAFTKLLLVLIASPPAPLHPSAVVPPPERSGGAALLLLVTALFASTWPVFGWFTALAAAGGTLFAISMRWWNDRHPAITVDVEPGTRTRPEINLSRIPVGGNAGGLIFAIGSVVIVIVGLPGLRWFLIAALLGGACTAAALFAWRRAHPAALQPRNSIAAR